MKYLLLSLFTLLMYVGVVNAQGYLDKEAGSKGEAVQTISPRKTLSSLYTGITGKASARPVKDVTNMKMLGFQAAASDNTAIPVEVRLCSGTTVATCNTAPMIYPLGSGVIAIGSDVKGVSFGVISSATERKVSVHGR